MGDPGADTVTPEPCTTWYGNRRHYSIDRIREILGEVASIIRDCLHSVKRDPPTSMPPPAGHSTNSADSGDTGTKGGDAQ